MLKRNDLAALADALGGLAVHGCLPDSAAERAGVRYGDVLLAVDGIPTPTWDAYIASRRHSVDLFRVRLFRDGDELEVEIQLLPSEKRSAWSIE